MNKFVNIATGVLSAALLSISLGCSVSVDKSKTGDDKNVKIDTPLGGVHVTSDQINAADVGLPVYPGAQMSTKKDGDKSADVHFGFGDWQFRLKVAKYQSPDSSDKVLAFYKKALGRYGDVIECNGRTAVGTPTVTREGLSCDDNDNHNKANVKMDLHDSLKAGSKRHQHIVGIEKSDGPGTTFSLVELDLPASSEEGNAQTN